MVAQLHSRQETMIDRFQVQKDESKDPPFWYNWLCCNL